MTVSNTSIAPIALIARLWAAAAALLLSAAAQAQPHTPASVAWDVEWRALNDLRSRGVSDSLMRPAVKLTVQAVHESGVIGQLEVNTASKKQFLDGRGLGVVGALGYRFGDPEGWHFGLGVAVERFPGARFDAPHGIDLESFTPLDVKRSTYGSDFLLLEAGFGALEARLLSVVSPTYRGANTGGVCGQILLVSSDQTAGLSCYARGDHGSRGTMLADLNYRLELDPRTTLNLHVGLQKVKNFREADTTDYAVGVTHRRWGLAFTGEWVGVNTRVREVYLVPDGARLRAVDNNRLVVSVGRRF